MHKNTTFLILLGTLLVAGGVVLREREEMREWQARQQVLNRQHVQPADNTASTPEINPATGWKIFKHPDVPITFEYPGEFRLNNKAVNKSRSLSLLFKSNDYFIQVSVPPPEKGTEGAEKVADVNMNLGEASFKVDILDFSSTKEKPHVIASSHYEQEDAFLKLLGYPTPNVGGFHANIQCATTCSYDETVDILKQIISSIRLASDPR
jgi:hypothetical protein